MGARIYTMFVLQAVLYRKTLKDTALLRPDAHDVKDVTDHLQ